jgi:hypothetical protein
MPLRLTKGGRFAPPFEPSPPFMAKPERRTTSTRIRLSESERAAILERKPQSVSLAEWLRSMAMDTKYKVIKTRLSPEQLDALRHLSWIGNNLNQLARGVNVAAREKRDIEQAFHALDNLSTIAQDIRKVREVVER